MAEATGGGEGDARDAAADARGSSNRREGVSLSCCKRVAVTNTARQQI